ncbi:hypothetical protein BH23ACT10_BH23ACT10_33910 [soil metagenome]
MQIDKQQILDLMNKQDEPGDPDKTGQAREELPEQVDTDKQEHKNLLEKFGINPQDLISKFAGDKFGL